jgi:hypothetical protein
MFIRCGELTDMNNVAAVPIALAMTPLMGFERGPYCKDCLGHFNLLAIGTLTVVAVIGIILAVILI